MEILKGFEQVNVYVDGLGIVKKTVRVENGKIAKICDCEGVDGFIKLNSDLIVLPGFIDEHVHGCNNSDGMYANLDDAKNISKNLVSDGTSSYLITTMTQSVDNIDAALKTAKELIDNKLYEGAKPLGIHLEGPFISKKYKGAQIESCIVPCDVNLFKHFEEVSGNHIKEVTLAYEENGKELVNYLKKKGIVASLGHTNATCDEALEGFREGATCTTHTYNAMKPLHHREAGVVGASLLNSDVYAELICDLIHVSDNAIRLLLKCKGKERIILITDSMESKNLPDGKYSLGGQDVYVKNGEARLIDGTLAGSTLKLNVGLRNFKKVTGLSLEDVCDLATKNPAKNLGIFDYKGSIKEGKDADFTVVDKDFNVYLVVSEGKIVYNRL